MPLPVDELAATAAAASALLAKHGAVARAGAAIGRSGEAVRKAAMGDAGPDVARDLARALGLDMSGLVAHFKSGQPFVFPDAPVAKASHQERQASEEPTHDDRWRDFIKIRRDLFDWAEEKRQNAVDSNDDARIRKRLDRLYSRVWAEQFSTGWTPTMLEQLWPTLDRSPKVTSVEVVGLGPVPPPGTNPAPDPSAILTNARRRVSKRSG